MDQAVEVEPLARRYGELVAVDGLSLKVPRGQVLDLFGLSGSGKATTISCILQLFIYNRGVVRVLGQPMTLTAYGLKRRIGMVSQGVAVFDELTVVENISAFCTLYVHDCATRRHLVDEAIAFVDLEKFVKFKPRKLSGGLLRRLNIACGIAHDPDLIVLDEPTAAVDPQNHNAILGGITRLNKQSAAVIHTSHYMEEVEQLCYQVTIMNRGGQATSGISDELRTIIGTGECIRVEIADPVPLSEETLESLRHLEHMRTTTYQEPEVLVECSPEAHNLSDVMGALAAAGATCGRMTFEPPALSGAFLEITGRALRNETA